MTVDVHLGPGDMGEALRADVRRGLAATPKWLPPKWFYDERGSQLFDEITRLPEYYPTRREHEILVAHAADVGDIDTLVELGSGTSTKTRVLLDAVKVRRYVPFDVDEATLRAAGEAIEADYPSVEVHGVAGDFERHIGCIPEGGPKLVAFLGGTIGNLRPEERRTFLAEVVTTMAAGDAFLLGTDLVKDEARLVAAYDDSAGVTAEFNRNVLHVLNRELGADFAVDRFDHVALWDAERRWMDIRLRSQVAQAVALPEVGMAVEFAAGEDLHTEISAKFRRPDVEAELAAAGLALRQWWTDAAGDFALSLSIVA